MTNSQFLVSPWTRRWRATSSIRGSMSIPSTRRAILAIGSVNQPSPQQISTTSVPRAIPTAAITPAGSGQSASHQPVVGISVPSKKPGSVSVTGVLDVVHLDQRGGRRYEDAAPLFSLPDGHALMASSETLFTPNFLLAPFALSEMNWYCGLS